MCKILVIFTGGTIACKLNSGIMDTDEKSAYQLIEKYCSEDKTVSFETQTPYFILSENLSGEYIAKLCRCAEEALLKDFDGIIVTHGTDTLQYSAAALDIFFGREKIPIVLVSSNHPLDEKGANGFVNFCAAVEYIKQGNKGGVFVAYKNNNDPLKFHNPKELLDYDCFSDCLRSADIDAKDDEISLNLEINLNKKSPVLRFKAYPGMEYPSVDGYKCAVIDTYHSGTIKTDDKEFLNFVRKSDIPVVLTGVSDGDIYKSAEDLKAAENVVFSRYCPIYTYMKCWVLAENSLDIEKYL